MLTVPSLIRSARVAIGMSQDQLAQRAGVSSKTVWRLEIGKGGTIETLKACQKVLEDHGIRFIYEDDRQGFLLSKEDSAH